MTKGHCNHGEFELTEGCPQCVAERQAVKVNQEAHVKAFENIASSLGISMKDVTPSVSIVKVQYCSDTKGTAGGRDYSYFTDEPLDLGTIVQVPVGGGRLIKAVVTATDVPESEIANFRDKVKTIPAGSKMIDQGPPVQTVTVVGKIEDTGSASQPPLVSTEEPVQEEAEPEAYGDPKPCPYVPALVCHKGVCANCDHIPTGQEVPPGGLAEAARTAGAEVKVVSFGAEEKPAALVTIETQVGKPVPQLLQLYLDAAGLLQFAKDRIIATNEDLKPATDDLALIAVCKKAMFARKTEIVEPFKARLDAINQSFGDLMFPVMEADRLTRGQVTTFDNEQRRKAAEAQRIEDAKLKLAHEEAALNGTGEHTQELGTAQAPPPVPERTQTDLGTLGGRSNWKARVVDFKLLPDVYKLPNETVLNSFARSTKGITPIPGVEFYDDRVVTMRAR